MANERQQVVNIAYGGYTAKPSDYDSEDGDLATVIGMVNEDGSLKPVMPPGIRTHLGENVEKVFIHKNSGYTHYILVVENSLWWCSDDWAVSDSPFLSIPEGEGIVSMEAVGHMLIVATDANMYYCRWKPTEEEYALLGNDVPQMRMQFALKGEVYMHSQDVVDIDISSDSGKTTTEDQWEVAGTCEFALRGSNGGNDKFAFAEDMQIEDGTEYSLRLAYTTSLPFGTMYLYGSPNGGSNMMLIGSFSLSRSRRTFTASGTYTHVYFTFSSSSFAQNYYYSNTLILEKGASDTIDSGYYIKYNEGSYNAVMGVINSFVNERATEKNLFIYPFYVRYAVKMYDGTYMHTSAPVLMCPNTGYVPIMRYYKGTDPWKIDSYAFIATLQYKFADAMGENWKDLIQGIDIFVSQPIFPYDQGQAFDSGKQLFYYRTIDNQKGINGIKGTTYGNVNATVGGVSVSGDEYRHIDLYDAISQQFGFGSGSTANNWNVIKIAPDEERTKKGLVNTSTFYHVCNIPFEDMPSTDTEVAKMEFTDVEMEKGTLSTLVTRTALTDELLSNRTFKTGKMYTYNNRLHLHSASYQLPTPDFMGIQNQFLTRKNSTDHVVSTTDIYVFVRTDDGERIVHKVVDEKTQGNQIAFMASIAESDTNGLAWFFYPDNRAYRAIIRIKSSNFADLKLKQHEYLNGAYWVSDDLSGGFAFKDGTVWEDIADTNDIVPAPHTVYVSETNNPFVFTSQLTVSIGCNEIIGMASAAKAMSTGQFGQYPLYAFTDNGVWALETSTTGAYTARQPITRDVCVNAESITQLDGEVLFATARGIMDLSGSASTCLSDTLEANKQFVLTDLMTDTQAEALLEYVNAGNDTEITLESLKSWGVVSFFEFIKTCRMIYDYLHQRIIVYNPSYAYAYVYSIKGKSWGMIMNNIQYGVNSYPDALAVDSDGNLVDFSLSDATGISGLIVTRPMKFGMQDIHKAVDTIIQRGYFRDSHVAQVLYASNNLFDWKGVWSSADKYLRGFSGTGYKYFRLALICKLDEEESLSGLTVRFAPVLTNRPR